VNADALESGDFTKDPQFRWKQRLKPCRDKKWVKRSKAVCATDLSYTLVIHCRVIALMRIRNLPFGSLVGEGHISESGTQYLKLLICGLSLCLLFFSVVITKAFPTSSQLPSSGLSPLRRMRAESCLEKMHISSPARATSGTYTYCLLFGHRTIVLAFFLVDHD
jgi:hypothetical protein